MALLGKYKHLIGLFFVSTSLLMVEILLLRFSRVAFLFDLQFIILSTAILGIGLGSLIVYVCFNKKEQKEVEKLFSWTSFFYALFSLVPFIVLHFANFYPQILVGVLFFAMQMITYVFAGLLVALMFRYYSSSIKIYTLAFINMIGAGLGAFLVIFLLDSIGIHAIIASFAIAALAFICYSSMKPVYIFIVSLSVLAILFFSSQISSMFQVICNPQGKLVSSMVNSFSQVDLYRTLVNYGETENGLLDNPTDKQIMFECSHVLTLPNYDLSDKLRDNFSSLPYKFSQLENVAIIGSGGGSEVVGAVLNNVKSVTAVEINPLVIKTVSKANPNNIYENKNVHLVLQEGRNYIAQSDNKFDLIYIPTSKYFGTIGARSFALQENYLYTKETFNLYLKHLTENGMIAILDFTPIIPQYVATLKASLAKNGLDINNIILAEKGKMSIMLYKNGGFKKEEMSVFAKEVAPLKPANLDILTNDKPYLAYRRIGNMEFSKTSSESAIFAYLTYFAVILLALYLILLLILHEKALIVRKNSFLLGLFTATGIGFICAELYLIEKLSLLLGHPSFAIALALSLLLIFGGIGNLLANKFSKLTPKVILALILSLIIYFFGMDAMINRFSSQEFLLRLVLGVLLLALPSFGMGMVFATSLKITQSISKELLPLSLTIDGFSSVLGGVIFKMIALFFGFTMGLAVAIAAYLGVLLILRVRK